jgi:hypothetical protein
MTEVAISNHVLAEISPNDPLSWPPPGPINWLEGG